MSAESNLASHADESLFAGLKPYDEQSLAAFDAALDLFEPDPALLGTTPARSLATAMSELVSSLTKIDIDRVARRQSWWARFTGADLEARVELEVATLSVAAEMKALAVAATAAERARQAMRDDIQKIDLAQARHNELAEKTLSFLKGADRQDMTVGRLEKRVLNLEAMIASNRLARAQMVLAIDHLGDLLARYADVEQLLFPLWQRHALAIAQGAAGIESNGDLGALRDVRSRFQQLMSQPRTAS